MSGGRPKLNPPAEPRKQIHRIPSPRPLPKQKLTLEQRLALCHLKLEPSHIVPRATYWEWVYRYKNSDLMLLIFISRIGKPQKHAWVFEGKSTEFQTLGEVATVLIARQKAIEKKKQITQS